MASTPRNIAERVGTNQLLSFDGNYGGNRGYQSGGFDTLRWATAGQGPDERFSPSYSFERMGVGFYSYSDSRKIGFTHGVISQGIVAPRLQDLSSGAYGSIGEFITLSSGTRRIFCPTIWSTDFVEEPIRGPDIVDLKTGERTEVLDWQYYVSFAVSIGQPLIPGNQPRVLQIEANGKIIYSRLTDAPFRDQMLGSRFQMRVYEGTEDQEPDPAIEADLGEGMAPAFRGLAYIVFEMMPISEFDYRRPNITCIVADRAGPQVQKIIYVNPNPDPFEFSSTMTVDWEACRLWAIARDDAGDNTRILEFSTTEHELIRNIDMQDQLTGTGPGMPGTVLGTRTLVSIPWLNALITNAGDLTIHQSILLIDVASGQFLTRFGPTSNSGTLGVNAAGQTDYFVPNRLFTDNGYETYIIQMRLTLGINSPFIVYRLFAPGEASNATDEWVMKPFSMSTAPDYGAVVPGKSVQGHCTFYAYHNNLRHIDKWTIYPGADWTAETAPPLQNGLLFESQWATMGMSAEAPITGIIYYEKNNSLYVAQGEIIIRIDADTGEVISFSDLLGGKVLMSSILRHNFWQSNLDAGVLGARIQVGNNVLFFNLDTMKEIFRATGASLNWENLRITDGRNFSFYAKDFLLDDIGLFMLDFLSSVRVSLADNLEGAARLSGLTVPDQFEVASSIDDMVDGALIMQPMSLESLIENVGTAYRLDRVELDGKILITRKPLSYDSADFEIPQNELALLSNDDPTSDSFVTSRAMANDLPRRAELQYLSKANDYGLEMQSAQRSKAPIDPSGAEDTIRIAIPLIITATEAKTLVNRMLWNYAWAGRVSSSFRLPSKYMAVVPSDVLSINDGEFVHSLRVVDITVGADNSIVCAGLSWLSDQPMVIPAAEVIQKPFIRPGQMGSVAVLLDMHLREAGDDVTHSAGLAAVTYALLMPMSGEGAWQGASLLVSVDGSPMSRVASSITNPIVGVLTADITPTPWPLQTQKDGSLNVRLLTSNEGLASIDDVELNRFGNLAAIGRPNTGWELIQFRDVVEEANGTFTLSWLRRGRRGSYKNTHVGIKGAMFVLLRTEFLSQLGITLEAIDRRLTWQALPSGWARGSGTPGGMTFQAIAAIPLEPRNLRARFVGPDVEISFMRQVRGDAPMLNGSGHTPLREGVQGFRLRVYPDAMSDDPQYETTEFTQSANRHRMLIPEGELISIYGTATPDEVYVDAAQFSRYLDAYGDLNRAAVRTDLP